MLIEGWCLRWDLHPPGILNAIALQTIGFLGKSRLK